MWGTGLELISCSKHGSSAQRGQPQFMQQLWEQSINSDVVDAKGKAHRQIGIYTRITIASPLRCDRTQHVSGHCVEIPDQTASPWFLTVDEGVEMTAIWDRPQGMRAGGG